MNPQVIDEMYRMYFESSWTKWIAILMMLPMWIIDMMRRLIRPAITVYSIYMLTTILFLMLEKIKIEGGVLGAESLGMDLNRIGVEFAIKNIIQFLILTAGTAVGFWFQDKGMGGFFQKKLK